jgi:polysaccharide pyruvyl transferase WcaK-like protein
MMNPRLPTLTRRRFAGLFLPLLGAARAAASGDRAPVILLWSAWDAYNIGDIGHTPGTLALLQKHIPEAEVILCANMLSEPVEALLRRRFPCVEIFQGRILGEEAWGADVEDAVARSDLFIRNSNMGAGTAYMKNLSRRGKPFGVYGQTYFPWAVKGEAGAHRLAQIAQARFFFCRETLTLRLLEQAGAACPHLEFVPDGCFGIDVRDDDAATKRLARLGLKKNEFITLQLRTHTPAHAPGELPPGYRPEWNRRPPNVPLDTARADRLIELIRAWVDATGHKVLLAPEAKKEIAQNRRFIYDRLPPAVRPYVVNIDGFWNVDEAASVFAMARAAVCHEPHSLIIALANGTPILHTYTLDHGPKYHMFRDIGLGDWLLPLDDLPPAAIADALLAIHRDPSAAREKVHAAMQRVNALQEYSMHVIRNELALPTRS